MEIGEHAKIQSYTAFVNLTQHRINFLSNNMTDLMAETRLLNHCTSTVAKGHFSLQKKLTIKSIL